MPKRELRILSAEEAHREQFAKDPLRKFFVWWDEVIAGDVSALRRALDRAREERDMQRYLERHPQLLVQHLGGGHGRWVVPQVRLGSQHVPDFIIGDSDSTGRGWTAVELEGPQRPMFNKSGDPSRYVWHAIRQIIDWRVWLEFNRDYASRLPEDGGLGLQDISPSVRGLVIVGRRDPDDEHRNAFRRGLAKQLDIDIHSYDWLIDRADGRVRSLAASASRGNG